MGPFRLRVTATSKAGSKRLAKNLFSKLGRFSERGNCPKSADLSQPSKDKQMLHYLNVSNEYRFIHRSLRISKEPKGYTLSRTHLIRVVHEFFRTKRISFRVSTWYTPGASYQTFSFRRGRMKLTWQHERIWDLYRGRTMNPQLMLNHARQRINFPGIRQ